MTLAPRQGAKETCEGWHMVGRATDDVIFFEKPAGWRRWLEGNHGKEAHLWVGFRKKGSGLPSLTWPESVDEALCFGWIDGVRKSVDGTSYKIRFSPRKPGTVWSKIN